jgi:murein DD-endopeptidase MepM/ murein hydrolase activator NlpD
MAESHIILLPQADYFKWVKAAQFYVLNFSINLTPDPVKAGEKDSVTVAVVPNGYPTQGNDIVSWLRARFPNLGIDAISVNTQAELTAVLQERINTQKRFGADIDRPTVITPPTPSLPTTSLPPDNRDIHLLWPSDYPVITQGFGEHPEIYGKWGLPGHEGLDIRAPMNTNIYACAEGVVFAIEPDPNKHPYGKHIRIRHADGFRTVYGHLAEIIVNVGESVTAKMLIGKADSTGSSTGSHLHLTLKKEGASALGETQFKGDVIDPTPYMIFPKKSKNPDR